MTPALAVQGVAVPVSKPGLPSFWPGLVQPPPVLLIVQEKLAEPVAAAASFAVAVVEYVPAVVGVPEIRPVEALMLNPAGRPVAVQVYGAVPPLADICRLLAVPTVPDCEPGLVTVTPPVPWVTMACEMAQLLVSLDQEACSA